MSPTPVSEQPSGILLVHKPVGVTSFHVVSCVRRITGIKKVGHCGTLDPFAEGVLPVCVGRATATVQFMESYDKRYRATLTLGVATDTQDCEGAIMAVEDLQRGWQDRLGADDGRLWREALASLEGENEQLPPMYSAVKVGGQPLYKLARRGQTVERKTRKIQVYEARPVSPLIFRFYPEADMLAADLEVDFHVSKGSYIRTLGVELGRRIGLPAHVSRLVRTACGPFRLEACTELNKLTAENWQARLLPPDRALEMLPALSFGEREARRLIQGQALPATEAWLESFGTDAAPAVLPQEAEETAKPRRLARAYAPWGFLGICRLTADEDGDPIVKAERMFGHLENH